MKTQMNINIETIEYLDNKGVTETLYEETAQVQENFYCTAFASIFRLNNHPQISIVMITNLNLTIHLSPLYAPSHNNQ